MIRYLDKYAIDSLKQGRLKVAQPTKLNDPYEFSMNIKGDNHHDDFIRDQVDLHIRTLSFCNRSKLNSNADILMWSHYADSHRGFRIHIDLKYLERISLTKWNIEYDNKIPEVDFDFAPHNYNKAIDADSSIYQTLKTKGTAWEYENEVRYFIDKNQCKYDKHHKHHYVTLPAKALTRVDIGLNTPPEQANEMEILLDLKKYSHVKMYDAVKVKGRYGIDYKRAE